MKISVLAAGAWGTALAIAFARRHAVTIWSRELDVAEDMQSARENTRYLPGFPLPDSLQVTTDLDAALSDPDLVIVATPIVGLRSTLEACGQMAKPVPVLWVCKGFEAGTGLLPHQVAAAVMPSTAQYGVLSGPSFAQEVAAAKPTALSLACNDASLAKPLAAELHGNGLRVYATDDLPGLEVGGAVKNVLAIATGVCDGLALGLNARAALMTRGLAEIARLGVALGAKRETFMGLAGMGDLILTCTGDLSRNRRVGLELAAGKTLPQILTELGHVAEGVPTALETAGLAERLGIEMPISTAVAAVLQGEMTAQAAVEALLSRDPADELR